MSNCMKTFDTRAETERNSEDIEYIFCAEAVGNVTETPPGRDDLLHRPAVGDSARFAIFPYLIYG